MSSIALRDADALYRYTADREYCSCHDGVVVHAQEPALAAHPTSEDSGEYAQDEHDYRSDEQRGPGIVVFGGHSEVSSEWLS